MTCRPRRRSKRRELEKKRVGRVASLKACATQHSRAQSRPALQPVDNRWFQSLLSVSFRASSTADQISQQRFVWHTHLYRPILHTGCASSADHANPQRLIHPLSYKVIKIEVCWPLLFIYHQWVICSAHLYWLSLAEVWGKIKRQVNFRYWVAGCLPNVGSHCWFFFLITSGGPIFVDII